MPILITAEVHGQTAAGYDGMLAVLARSLKAAPGLLLHSSHATEDGWRVVEVWASKAESDRFFARFVAPQLPPGIRPKRQYTALHNVVTPAFGGAGSQP